MRNSFADSTAVETSFPGWTPRFAEALQRLAIPQRRPTSGARQGDSRSANRGRATEFADYRPYASGDDLKMVDWRAYARFGRLFLKQHEEERARTVTVLVDVSASMDAGDGDAHKGRFARRLAAGLAWIAVSRHETVVIRLLRDGAARRLQPVSTPTGVVAHLRELAAVPDHGGTDLAQSVRSVASGPGRGPTLLISDLLEPDWSQALTALSATGDAMVVQPLAPTEWAPPPGEEVELYDAETGATVATRMGPPELAAYDRRLRDFLAGVRGECRRLGIPYAALNTGAEIQDVFFNQLPSAGILE